MDRTLRLRDYAMLSCALPVGIAPGIGRYPLAILAEKSGTDASIVDVVEAISAGCVRNKERHPGRRCQAYLPDLVDPRPPDVPAAEGLRLRVIEGGKA